MHENGSCFNIATSFTFLVNDESLQIHERWHRLVVNKY